MRKILFIFAAVLLGSIGLHAETQITYTAPTQLSGTQFDTGATTFGPAITSHYFDKGVGMITCAGDITQIGDWAFGNSGLTSITIPNSVKTIGSHAFNVCRLTSITIPNSVTSIGEYAFGWCGQLTFVKVCWTNTNSIVSINDNVFYQIANEAGVQGATLYVPAGMVDLYKQANVWKNFSKITLPPTNIITYHASERLSSESRLEEGATTFGPAITKHEFSNGVGMITCAGDITTIGQYAFYQCSALISIDIPNAVTTIGDWAFGNSGLTSITIPNSVKTIGSYAFNVCRFTSITIPGTVTTIRRSAFSYCENLKTIYCYAVIPPSLEGEVFTNMPTANLSVYVFNDSAYKDYWLELPAESFKLMSTIVEIEGIKYEFLGGDKVRVIGKNGGYTGDIKIPEQIIYQGLTFSVTEIGQAAFKNCSDLTSVTIGNSVTMIGDSAFVHCSGLESVTIPNSVTTIKQGAFNGCSGLKSLTIGNSVATIGDGAFNGCSGLLSLTIGNSVTTIGDGAFYGCTGLKEIGVASGNPKYDSRNCNAIIEKATNTLILGCKNTKIPNSVTTIGRSAFDGCYDLKDITLPNSVTTIGANAFAGCTGLTSIDIPSSVTTIGDGAFSHCALGAVTLPVSVMQIGKRAFEYCEQLKSVKLPSNLTLIDEGTFQHTGLDSVVIPVSVKRIENYAFDACRLNYVECIPETPPTLGSTNTFTKNDAAIVYVPTPEATVAYKSSDWAKYFTKIYSYITYRQTSSNTVEVIDALPIDNKVEIPAMFSSLGTFYKVTGIGNDAFRNKTSLHSISLPPTIQYIGNDAFNGCEKLKDINIEYIEDLQTIGYYAFYNCSALDSVVIPDSVQILDNSTFYGCKSLTYVGFPAGLHKIWDRCFLGCKLQPEITIPEGVDTIGPEAFDSNLSLQTVYLPSTLKGIRDKAFNICNAITKIVCLAPNPPTLGETIFTNQKTAVVYVPDRDVMKTYQNSSWKNYNFTFADLMAEENMKYLYEVAGNNAKAKEIAQTYCDSIRKDTTTLQVQLHTNNALVKIDSLTLTDYKDALVDSLNHYAKDNAEAKQIAGLYAPRITNAISRPDAEQLFAEAYMKITDIYELIELKNDYKKQLVKLAGRDNDLLKVATDYGALIDRAETKEEARALYERATMRMNINKQIKYDWNGGSVEVNNHTCTTTKGY